MNDLALQALAGAQRTGRRRRVWKQKPAKFGQQAVYSTAGSDERDPELVGGVLSGLIDEMGWQRSVAEARVFADWPKLVGAGVAAHCQPTALRDGELRVSAESTAWATELRRLSGTVLARLVAELGPNVVTKLMFSGPTGPSWKHGGWSVRGARGPRDTYG